VGSGAGSSFAAPSAAGLAAGARLLAARRGCLEGGAEAPGRECSNVVPSRRDVAAEKADLAPAWKMRVAEVNCGGSHPTWVDGLDFELTIIPSSETQPRQSGSMLAAMASGRTWPPTF
jgi:hypothetical protein